MIIKELPANLPRKWITQHTQTILNSYKKWTGKDLLSFYSELRSTTSDTKAACQIFWAPFAVLSSDHAADPVLTYGNQKTLDLWEMSWKVLTQTEGRKTAEALHRDERQKFLDTVKKNGFIDNYSGVRISSSGKKFRIERATVWNLIDEKGIFTGQAATFNSWKYL